MQLLIDDKHAVARSDNRFYGIVDKSILAANGWVLNSEATVRRPQKAYDFIVCPVSFLEHFESKYQSANGMRFMAIEGKDDLAPLPVHNPDYLVLGTRNGGIFKPILAISSNVVPNTNTMSLELFTSRIELDLIQKFWNTSWSASKTLSEVRSEIERKLEAAPSGGTTP